MSQSGSFEDYDQPGNPRSSESDSSESSSQSVLKNETPEERQAREKLLAEVAKYERAISSKKIQFDAITRGPHRAAGGFGSVDKCSIDYSKLPIDVRNRLDVNVDDLLVCKTMAYKDLYKKCDIYREMSSLCHFSHTNILQLKYWSEETVIKNKIKVTTVRMVTEDLGLDLNQYLHDTKKKLTGEQIMYIMYRIASAVDYIHESAVGDNQQIHRDIKPANIILHKVQNKKNLKKGEDLKPMLIDFGLARNTDYDVTSNTCSVVYGSPQQILSSDKLCKATDVFSLSSTLWMILHASLGYKSPYPLKSLLEIQDKIKNNERPKIDESLPLALRQLMIECWELEPEKRPTAGEVATAIQKIRRESNVMLELNKALNKMKLSSSKTKNSIPEYLDYSQMIETKSNDQEKGILTGMSPIPNYCLAQKKIILGVLFIVVLISGIVAFVACGDLKEYLPFERPSEADIAYMFCWSF